MTVALCLYCGEMKYGALFECDKCNHAPTGDEQIDIIFTDWFFDQNSLDEFGGVIKALKAQGKDSLPVFRDIMMHCRNGIQEDIKPVTQPTELLKSYPCPYEIENLIVVFDRKNVTNEAQPFLRLFLNDLDFAVKYLSIFYPFLHADIDLLWDYLVKGDAHYPVFLCDTDTLYSPKMGLCFNSNTVWIDELKERWGIGFWDPFNGYFIGLGDHTVEYDDIDKFRGIIPLDLRKYNDAWFESALDYYAAIHGTNDGFDIYCDEISVKLDSYNCERQKQSFSEFMELYENKRDVILYNPSIWQNTLRYIIDDNFMRLVMKEFIRRHYITTTPIDTDHSIKPC